MALTGEWTELTDEIIHRFIKRIKTLPSVTPVEKTGRWIPVTEKLQKSGCVDVVTDTTEQVGNPDRGQKGARNEKT